MTVKTTFAALALILVPTLSLAFGCSGRGNHAQSCAPGTVWDSVQQSCVKAVTG